ncbi:MAG: hypothetical protein WBF51_09185, partial [Candidatus Dormiibacterota bacterium]
IEAATNGLRWVSLPTSGASIGQLESAWTPPIGIRAPATVQLAAPAGARFKLSIRFRRVRAPLRRGAEVGTLVVTTAGGSSAHAQLISDRGLDDPSWGWRLRRPW